MSDLTALDGISASNQGLLTSGLGAFGSLGGGIAGLIQGNRNAEIQRKLGIQAQEREAQLTGRLDAKQRIAIVGLNPNAGTATDIGVDLAGEGALAGLRARYGFDSAADSSEQRGRLALARGTTKAAGTLFGASISKLGKQSKDDQLGASDTRRLAAIKAGK